jgi:manganese transport protein
MERRFMQVVSSKQEGIAIRNSLAQRSETAVRTALEGRARGLRAFLPFVGPAVIASVGYMDPGNYATNIQAGAQYGYGLLWVVILSSVLAMLFQALSARIGIATGCNLAELCRDHFPRPVVLIMWLGSELAAMATDLAEFLGGALALSLVLHQSLLAGMFETAVVTFAFLALDKRGYRPLELVIGAMVALIGVCYVCELWIAPVNWGDVAASALLPRVQDHSALVLAIGIVGATIMPHTLYLHSGLTQKRAPARNRAEMLTHLRYSNREVILALGAAGCVNMAMVIMAASAFHATSPDIADLAVAYHALIPALGAGAAAIFLTGLLASGLSSSVVGTMAGQMIMEGFVHRSIPAWVRRLVTIIPSFGVLVTGCNVTHAMLISQVVLSMTLPMPMMALLIFSRRRALMGELVIGKTTFCVAAAGALVVGALNVVLIAQAFN